MNSERGRLYYLPESLHQAINLEETPVPQVFQTRTLRPHRIHIARVAAEVPSKAVRKSRKTVSVFFGKLAGSKDNAKRFFRSFIAFPLDTGIKPAQLPDPVKKPKPKRPLSWAPGSSPEPDRRRHTLLFRRESKRRSTTEIMRPNIRHSVAGPIGVAAPHPIFTDEENNSSSPALENLPNTGQRIPDEKPVASGNGVSIGIALAEPFLFLQGFEQGDLSANPSTAMLRGSLHLKVTKAAKLKAVTLKFMGKATTKWPEGRTSQNMIDHVC